MSNESSAREDDDLGGKPDGVGMLGPLDARLSAAGARQIPPSVLGAIAAAAGDPRDFEVACRLVEEDAGQSGGDEHVRQGRLERAIARALMDAWRCGQGTAEAVGSAYVLVARCVCESK